MLHSEIGTPMLRLTALTLDTSGSPIEYFRAFYRGDRTSFEVRVDAHGEAPR
jgi:DNA-binding GntR family transcriptional regulator